MGLLHQDMAIQPHLPEKLASPLCDNLCPHDPSTPTVQGLQISTSARQNNSHDISGATHIDKVSSTALPPPLLPQFTPSLSSTKTVAPQTTTNTGIDLWRKWIGEQPEADQLMDTQISPHSLLAYLDTIILPLATPPRPSLNDDAHQSDNLLPGSTTPDTFIQTYIRPILLLWQEQSHLNPEQHTYCPASDNFKTSSPTVSSPLDVHPLTRKTTDAQRQHDHAHRLNQLEQSHRDTTLVISQLQDQVQRLVLETNRHPDHHHHCCNSYNRSGIVVDHVGREAAIHRSSPNDSHSRLLTTDYNHSDDASRPEDAEMTTLEHQPWQVHSSRRGHHEAEQCRADELIGAIARGLEEYRSRCSRRHMQRHHLQDGNFWCHDEDYHPENPLQLPQRPLSPSSEAPAPLIPEPPSSGRLHSSEALPLQHPPYDACIRRSQRHAGFQQDDFLLPGQRELQDTRNRKRSSSMSGPEAQVREGVKMARSCSPTRPRTSSGTTAVELNVAVTSGHIINTGGTFKHTQSQPPPASASIPLTSVTYTKSSSSGHLPQDSSKEITSAFANPNVGMELTRGQAGQHSQHAHRLSRIHKHSHTSQLSGSVQHVDEEGMSYQKLLDHRLPYPADTSALAAYGSHHISSDHHYSPYYPSTAEAPMYRGRGQAMNQSSLSAQYTAWQHPYQRNDERSCQGYDHQQHHHEIAQLGHVYPDLQEEEQEDVKPSYHRLQRHQTHQKQQQQQQIRQDAPPPIYVMNRQVNTVPELWREWTIGLGPGNPSIRQLEAQYGPSWRTSSSAANFFSRRLRIINEIQRLIDFEGLSEDEAVNRLETRREQGVLVPGTESAIGSDGQQAQSGGMSLHRLSEILRKKQL